VAKLDIKSLSIAELKGWLESVSQKAYRADQIQHWLFKELVTSFDQMVNIPQDLRERLAENFRILSLEEHTRTVSSDGTIKFAFRTHDNHFIETVLIPRLQRNSVCVSTQVGCAMGCTFCRTATMGEIRNLESGEIIEQIAYISRFLRLENDDVTNIIFMGMGEPMHNLLNVHRSCEILHERRFFNLGAGRMTISSSGVVPRLYELMELETPCKLAISLNGTNDAMRAKLMPVNLKWPMEELFGFIDEYIRRTGDYVTLEYILIKDVTCTPQAAKELLKLAQQRRVKINAIVLNNPERPGGLEPPSQEDIDAFLELVRAGHVHIILRTPRGRDILAACGQLAIQQKKVKTC